MSHRANHWLIEALTLARGTQEPVYLALAGGRTNLRQSQRITLCHVWTEETIRACESGRYNDPLLVCLVANVADAESDG